jgi:hypothetical protein
MVFFWIIILYPLNSSLSPGGLLQHRQRERIQGGGGLRLVATEGVEQIS